jgi:hypothetical protein
MSTINNLGLQGRPMLPYIDFRSYAGADIFIDLTFLDHTMAPVVPTSIVYEIDDISNAQNMVTPTSVPSNGTSMQTLQIPGATMVMSYPYQGSQLCQVEITATLIDSVTGVSSTAKGLAILELVAIQTPSGT